MLSGMLGMLSAGPWLIIPPLGSMLDARVGSTEEKNAGAEAVDTSAC